MSPEAKKLLVQAVINSVIGNTKRAHELAVKAEQQDRQDAVSNMLHASVAEIIGAKGCEILWQRT